MNLMVNERSLTESKPTQILYVISITKPGTKTQSLRSFSRKGRSHGLLLLLVGNETVPAPKYGKNYSS
jgi:hypothetical protein